MTKSEALKVARTGYIYSAPYGRAVKTLGDCPLESAVYMGELTYTVRCTDGKRHYNFIDFDTVYSIDEDEYNEFIARQ